MGFLMRYLFAFAMLLGAATANSAEIIVTGYKDGLALGKSDRTVTIFLDGNLAVEAQKLPVTLETNAKRVDITICADTSNYCDSATISPESGKSTEVGFLVQSFMGNIYFKTLTGGGLKVIKDRASVAEAQAKAIEEAKRNDTKP